MLQHKSINFLQKKRLKCWERLINHKCQFHDSSSEMKALRVRSSALIVSLPSHMSSPFKTRIAWFTGSVWPHQFYRILSTVLHPDFTSLQPHQLCVHFLIIWLFKITKNKKELPKTSFRNCSMIIVSFDSEGFNLNKNAAFSVFMTWLSYLLEVHFFAYSE